MRNLIICLLGLAMSELLLPHCANGMDTKHDELIESRLTEVINLLVSSNETERDKGLSLLGKTFQDERVVEIKNINGAELPVHFNFLFKGLHFRALEGKLKNELRTKLYVLIVLLMEEARRTGREDVAKMMFQLCDTHLPRGVNHMKRLESWLDSALHKALVNPELLQSGK